MSQSTKSAKAPVTSARVARRIVRNYLRITLVAALEPEAVSAKAVERAEAQLSRVPGYENAAVAAVKAAKAPKNIAKKAPKAEAVVTVAA